MQGYRTYVSILLTVAGSFGLFERIGVTQEDVAKVIDLVVVAGAGIAALYLNWQNHKKMK
mgnify:CR=1 FL=1